MDIPQFVLIELIQFFINKDKAARNILYKPFGRTYVVFINFLNIYLFGHIVPLVAACGILVLPQPGMEPQPSSFIGSSES